MSFAEPEPDRDGVDLWWVEPAGADADAEAARRGLVTARRIHQLRRPLPLPATLDRMGAALPTRPFRPDHDDAAWLATNAAAFASHPDQGRWTAADLAARRAESWFDPEDFLVHEIDGRLAGFCWTKLHPAGGDDPAMGEIFVIGVHPDVAGRGLGRALTAAGLRSLWTRHRTPVGMLYVEATNERARGLYASMGFEHHHDRVAYRRTRAG